MTDSRTPSSPERLDLPIRGRHLRASTLDAELAGEATLLVFLRHLG